MEEGIHWTRNISGIPLFTHALLKEHLITDDSSKHGKLPNVHKHKKLSMAIICSKIKWLPRL
jgi:hypothetical protein